MTADQNYYAFENSHYVRRIIIKPGIGYVVVKANSDFRFCGECIEGNSGTKAVQMGRIYVLQNDRRFNEEWHHNGRVYRSIRSLRNLLESSDLTFVTDSRTAEILIQELRDYECQKMLELWELFNSIFQNREKGFDSENWLNFINFVKLVESRKNDRRH